MAIESGAAGVPVPTLTLNRSAKPVEAFQVPDVAGVPA